MNKPIIVISGKAVQVFKFWNLVARMHGNKTLKEMAREASRD